MECNVGGEGVILVVRVCFLFFFFYYWTGKSNAMF